MERLVRKPIDGQWRYGLISTIVFLKLGRGCLISTCCKNCTLAGVYARRDLEGEPMRQFVMVFLGMVFFATLGYGQDSLSAPSQAPAPIAHGAFSVKVTKTLDSSKLKQDDSIEVETAGSFKLSDGTLVPKGSKMMGRVVTATA